MKEVVEQDWCIAYPSVYHCYYFYFPEVFQFMSAHVKSFTTNLLYPHNTILLQTIPYAEWLL